jgi:uncharacterized protein
VFDFIATLIRQTATIRTRDHRPWPLPRTPWVMGQTWHDLLFAHWPLPPAALRPLVPRAFALDTCDGHAWVGITPFVVSGLRLAVTPPLPEISRFPELNVRTYVSLEQKPGIYFFSLDAGSRLAVAGARRLYHLPYFFAEMCAAPFDHAVRYDSKRVDERGQEAEFQASYRPIGNATPARRGSLEHFLVERYCLYTTNGRGEALRAEIHHPPWPLQAAEADIELNTMAPSGLKLPKAPALLHFAARQDVLIWRAAKVSLQPGAT